MSAMFVKTKRLHDVLLSIHVNEDAGGPLAYRNGEYIDISKPLTEHQLLEALAAAYSFGFEAAQQEAQEAVRRLLYERKRNYAPNPKRVKQERSLPYGQGKLP